MKPTRTKPIILGILLAAALAWPAIAPAQTHYPAGVEGLKAASLPPPGLYFRDYNYFYWSDHLDNGPENFNLFAYIQAPRLVWISDFKLLGAFYGADVLVPFAYQSLRAGGFDESSFGLADIFVEPVTLSWHPKQFDLAVGYGFWAPSGNCSRPESPNPVAPGKGFWTHMLTAGATWYPDEAKTWSVSLLNRYEFNQENTYTDITPGQYLTMEWGIGKTFEKFYEFGFVGYYQQQTTAASAGADSDNARQWVVGLGPEISITIPKIALIASARYLYEVGAHDRPQGHTANLTLTKRF
jgi:hypothetical protein